MQRIANPVAASIYLTGKLYNYEDGLEGFKAFVENRGAVWKDK
ncbi:hypothetical protein [Candidatus Puniceispirillum sp.]